jgi:hypothetical protein
VVLTHDVELVFVWRPQLPASEAFMSTTSTTSPSVHGRTAAGGEKKRRRYFSLVRPFRHCM